MGRLFVEFVDEEAAAKYICCRCSCDVASEQCLLWEGVMGAATPALLLRHAVNLELCGPKRQEVLSTGRYTLCDVRCRACCTRLGWQYLAAEQVEQRYKEGCVILQQAALRRVSVMHVRR